MNVNAATMLDVAFHALEHGYAVVPPKQDGSKRPDGQWKTYQQQLPTEDEVRAWYAAGRTGIGVITGAVSGNLEMLEFEGRAMEENIGEQFVDLAGAAGLTELVDRINAGYCETTPTGGLHLLYRVTGPVAGNTKLARRPATADELAAKPDDPIRVLIETRGEGGYVVVAPSHGHVHPTGSEWVLLNGGFDQVATITEAERDELHRIARALDTLPTATTSCTTPAAAPSAALLIGDGDRPGDAYNSDPGAPQATLQLLERHGWAEVFRRPHDGHQDVHLRRPGKNIGTSAVLHLDAGTLVVFSTSTTFDTEVGYTPFAVLTALEHGGDYSDAARTLRPAGIRDDLAWANVNGATPAAPCPDGSDPHHLPDGSDPHHLPDDFWTARPELEHVRSAARARRVAPDAVLAAVLARVAACTPHPVELPGIVGSPVGLTFYAGIVGPPEAGKSAASSVAAELLPAPPSVLDLLPIGSGEGMVEILFDLVDEDDGAKKRKVKRQVKHAAIFHIDEGAILSDLAGRQGSTLLPTLRTAYTHGTLGNANASTERKRIVNGKTYVYGITLGIQPELAGPLLADTAAGTPQRFVWVMATDPSAPDARPDWPGVLPWEPPDAGNLEPYAIVRGGFKRYQLDVDDTIAKEIDGDRITVMRGEQQRASGDAHQMLVRLKTAALLALLNRRLEVTIDDWHLAETITTTSRAIRRTVEGTLAAIDRGKEQAHAEKLAQREMHVEGSKEKRALASAAKSIANIVVRHHDAGRHLVPPGCIKSCAKDAVAGKHKGVITLTDALDDALRRGFIVDQDGRYLPGDARPA